LSCSNIKIKEGNFSKQDNIAISVLLHSQQIDIQKS